MGTPIMGDSIDNGRTQNRESYFGCVYFGYIHFECVYYRCIHNGYSYYGISIVDQVTESQPNWAGKLLGGLVNIWPTNRILVGA